MLLNSSITTEKETRMTKGWVPTAKGSMSQEPGRGEAGSRERPLKYEVRAGTVQQLTN